MKRTVTFEPSGTAIDIEEGKTLLDAAQAAGIPMGAVCGGRGTCGKCRVKIRGGAQLPASESEEQILSPAAVRGGERLACRTTVTGSITVETLQISGHGKSEAPPQEPSFVPVPVILRCEVSVLPPTFGQSSR